MPLEAATAAAAPPPAAAGIIVASIAADAWGAAAALAFIDTAATAAVCLLTFLALAAGLLDEGGKLRRRLPVKDWPVIGGGQQVLDERGGHAVAHEGDGDHVR